ncbi:MAG TPA: AraD1 family protein, partial [Vicinamibacteria bacterium]
QLGLDHGKPADGSVGIQPEWFYKGDGHCLARPGHALEVPDFSLDAGEEPEIVGLYVVGDDGTPYRVGFALGNELADHVTERQNYLYLAHSKLRKCSVGPELLLGELPQRLSGQSRVVRDGQVLWQGTFRSGEAHMSHRIAGLEHHHFKYSMFRQPGQAHVHFFGTATLSFAAGIRTRPGDCFEIECSEFGKPLQNTLRHVAEPAPKIRTL